MASLHIPTITVDNASHDSGDREQIKLGISKSHRFMNNASKYVMKTADHMFKASFNSKFSRKVFRSSDAIEEEQKRQHVVNRFIIHPFSAFRWYWDLFMVFILCLTLIMLPINIAFYTEDLTSLSWKVINILFDVVFFLDMLLNFRTGYVEHSTENIILDNRKVMINYLKTWFAPDLISSIPFDYVYISLGDDTDIGAYLTLKVLRLTKLLSLLRVFRMARLLRYINKLEEILKVEGSVIRIVNLIIIILVLSHWNGCMQYLVIFLSDFPENSWVVKNNLTSPDATVADKYLMSIFKAMSHMLSIGYGRFPPENKIEIITIMVSMMLGATFYALFIGHMSSLLLTLDSSGRIFNEKLAQVKEYLRYHKVPMSVQERLLTYYDHKYQRKYFDESVILSDISSAIRKDIMKHNSKNLVDKVPFLSIGTPEFMFNVISKLIFEVFLPGDTIISAGAKGDGMFFIEHGKVEVLLPNGELANTLGDGHHFGEISLLMEERRVASVIALETCDVFFLSREHFNDVLQDYPEMRKEMLVVARQRLSEIGQLNEIGDDFDGILNDDENSISSSLKGMGPSPTPQNNSNKTTISSIYNRLDDKDETVANVNI